MGLSGRPTFFLVLAVHFAIGASKGSDLLKRTERPQTGQARRLEEAVCGKGEYFDGGTCTDCQAGRFNDESDSTSLNCTSCKVGTYQPLTGASNCTDCPAGTFLNLKGSTSASDCAICTSGKYSSQGSATCQYCPAGTYNMDLATDAGEHDSVADCEDCEAGSISSEDFLTCDPCDAGTYVLNKTSCEVCPSGTYAPKALENQCVSCPAGFYTGLLQKAILCTPCDAGTFSLQESINCTYCTNGTYSTTSSSSCTSCPEGSYSTNCHSQASPCTSCTACAAGRYQNRERSTSCVACKPGTSQSGAGQSSCNACNAGRYSQEEASACTGCSAGKYQAESSASACEDCPLGKYQSAASQTKCDTCEGGTRAGVGATSCTDCNAGMFSSAGAWNCSKCEPGTYSSSQSSICTVCGPGKYSDSAASSSCKACASGKAQAQNGSTECEECEMGYYQQASESASCDACSVGYFSPQRGGSQCLKCSSENRVVGTKGDSEVKSTYYTSKMGSSNCSICIPNYYMDDNGDCRACPFGADCTLTGSTLAGLIVKPGFYRFDTTAKEVDACPFPNDCVGGNVTGEALCSEGSYGPLCHLCKENYYLRDAVEACTLCRDVADTWFLGPLILFIVAALMGAAYYIKKAQIEAWLESNKQWVEEQLDEWTPKATMLFITMQIIVLMQSNHEDLGGEDTPAPYNQFVASLGIFSLDLMQMFPMDCAVENTWTHWDSLLLETLLPLGIIFGVVLFLAIRLIVLAVRGANVPQSKPGLETKNQKSDPEDEKGGLEAGSANTLERPLSSRLMIRPPSLAQIRQAQHNDTENLNNTVLGYVVVVLLLVLPTISRRIAQSYRCKTFDGGDEGQVTLLAVDYSIDCTSASWHDMQSYMYITALIYPIGIPLCLLGWLYRFKHRLDPDSGALSEAEAIELRNKDPGLLKSPIAAFGLVFRPRYWWYEIWNLMRRLFLTTFVLVFENAAAMTIFILLFATVALVLEREARPYRSESVSNAVYVMQWQVVFYVQCMLLLDAGVTGQTGKTTIGVTLLLANLTLISLVLIPPGVFVNPRHGCKFSARATHSKTKDTVIEFERDSEYDIEAERDSEYDIDDEEVEAVHDADDIELPELLPEKK